MKNIISCLIIFLIVGVNHNLQGQKMTLLEVLDALSNMDVFVENRKLKKRIVQEMKSIEQMEGIDPAAYEQLQGAYTNLLYTYNNDYLSYIKMDLSDPNRLKRVIENPAVAAKGYVDRYALFADQYNLEFQPALQYALYGEDADNSDLLTIVSFGFKIFKRIVGILKQRKLDKGAVFQIVISQVNDHLFRKLELPEWESFQFQISEEMQIEDSEMPPMETATIPEISGYFSFDLYDASSEGNTIMQFQKGLSTQAEGYDYGEGEMSGDIIVGRPGSKKERIQTVQKWMTSYETVTQYPAETYYKIKASGNGFIYIFSVNSNNKMYSFYPNAGELEDLPYGTSFSVDSSDERLASKAVSDGQAMVTIPNEDEYLMIYDPPGTTTPVAETLVILLSKTALDTREIFEYMENASAATHPQDRLVGLFGSQTATLEDADIGLEFGQFSYLLEEDDPAILPLVFSINRE